MLTSSQESVFGPLNLPSIPYRSSSGIVMSSPTAETEDTSAFPPRQEFKGHTSSVTGIIHLPGGKRTITSSGDGSLRLWNMESGLQIGKDWRDGDGSVFDIALSPDGKRVVSGSEDGSVRLWDIHAEKMIAKWTGHTCAVMAVCWSEDGRRVVSGCFRGTAMEWDVESGESILGPLRMVDGFTLAFGFSPKNAMIATATMGENTKYSEEIWDFKTRKLVITLNGKRRIANTRTYVNCLVWTADGEKLITATIDLITIWNCKWEEIAGFKVRGPSLCSTNSIAVSPNGRIFAIAAYIGGAFLLNLENGQPIVGQSKKPVDCVSFSTDGKLQSCGFTAHHYKESSPGDVEDYVIDIYDIEAILKKTGLRHLLLDVPKDDDKPVLDADATRAAVQQPEDVRRLRLDFFDDTHTRASPSHLPPHSSAGPGHARAPSAPYKWRFSLLSRSEHTAHERQALNWTRAPFVGRLPRRDKPYGERHPVVVETPYTRGQARNVKVTRESKEKVPAPSNIMTISIPGPSRAQISGTGQKSSGDGSGRNPLLPSQLAVNTTPAAAMTITSAAETPLDSESAPDTMVIRQAGCWTRFWLSLGCIPATEQR